MTELEALRELGRVIHPTRRYEPADAKIWFNVLRQFVRDVAAGRVDDPQRVAAMLFEIERRTQNQELP
jgi:hypothetical protein